jgi:hypothetical protein
MSRLVSNASMIVSLTLSNNVVCRKRRGSKKEAEGIEMDTRVVPRIVVALQVVAEMLDFFQFFLVAASHTQTRRVTPLGCNMNSSCVEHKTLE